MCILSYIYGSNSLELGEDIELFYVAQDFCLVTVVGPSMIQSFRNFQKSLIHWNTPILLIRFCTMSMRKLIGHSTYCSSLRHMQQINLSSWTLLFTWRKRPWSFGGIFWGRVILQTRWTKLWIWNGRSLIWQRRWIIPHRTTYTSYPDKISEQLHFSCLIGR